MIRPLALWPLIGLALSFEPPLHAQPDGTALVRGGTFRRGTASSAIPELRRRYSLSFPGAFEDEVPEHTVTVGDFRMDRDEVTNERSPLFVAANPGRSREKLPPGLHNGR